MRGPVLLVCGHRVEHLDALNYQDGQRLDITCRVCGMACQLVACWQIVGPGDLGWHVCAPVCEADARAARERALERAAFIHAAQTIGMLGGGY